MFGKGELTTARGVLPGLVLVAGWLIAWRLLSNAAGLFAPATASFGFVCLLLSLARPAERWPAAHSALKTAARVAFVVAVAASFSVGAFMPAQLAEWASPALGKFGGETALLIVALGLAALEAARNAGRGAPRGLRSDAIMACVLGALWVGSQVARQPSFPPAPTTAALLAPRLALVFGLGVAFAILAALLWGAAYRGRSMAAGPDSAGQASLTATAAPWLWRWAGLMAALGLAGSLAVSAGSWVFALLALVVLAGGLVAARLGAGEPRGGPGRVAKAAARGVGWLGLGLLVAGLAYFTTAEDLEVVMLRNTAEWHVMQFWRGLAGDERFAAGPVGALSGSVLDGLAKPIAGAAVVVATVGGQAYTGYADAQGRFLIDGVPAGNYLPRAVAPGYRQAPPSGQISSVVTVRPGQTAGGVDFLLQSSAPPEPQATNELDTGPPTTARADNPQPSEAVRRPFTFTNESMLLKGGLVHEPPAAMGPGPFPILLIIFPGEARLWEGVSVPLASNGYVVVSYFPVRLLDLEGDVRDLEVLLGLTAGGKLSARGDASKIVLIGGSVSTAYTYLMARELEGSPAHESLKAAVQYGGLFDFFRYRQAWEKGEIVIDPGISELEYLLIAFGRPDTRPELYLRLSPRYALGSHTMPPTLLVHTGKDIIVPVEQSHLADEKFASLGIPRKLIIYPNLEHYLDTSKRDPEQLDMLDQTLGFLKEYTK